jgi:hypothetical protein
VWSVIICRSNPQLRNRATSSDWRTCVETCVVDRGLFHRPVRTYGLLYKVGLGCYVAMLGSPFLVLGIIYSCYLIIGILFDLLISPTQVAPRITRELVVTNKNGCSDRNNMLLEAAMMHKYYARKNRSCHPTVISNKRQEKSQKP